MNNALVIFGWLVLAGLSGYALRQTWNMLFLSLGFTGKLSGEFWFVAVIACALTGVAVYTFPFDVSMLVHK